MCPFSLESFSSRNLLALGMQLNTRSLVHQFVEAPVRRNEVPIFEHALRCLDWLGFISLNFYRALQWAAS